MTHQPVTWCFVMECDACGGDALVMHGVPSAMKGFISIILRIGLGLLVFLRLGGKFVSHWEPEDRPSMIGVWDFRPAHFHSEKIRTDWEQHHGGTV